MWHAGPAAAPSSSSKKANSMGQFYQGTVKSIGEKFGFIECEGMRENFGADCFCQGDQLVGYAVGEAVKFELALGKEGKPQALNLSKVRGPNLPITPVESSHAQGPASPRGHKPGPTPTGETYEGVIKSIGEKFGFIECASIQASYGCDCFCLGDHLYGYSVGESVTFQVGLNQTGKPQAITVQRLGAGQMQKKKPVATGEKLHGTIKSLGEKYGFIECQAIQATYGCDCFCLGIHLVGFSVGEAVSFEVGVNQEGKPQALVVERLAGPALQQHKAPTPTGETYQGVVKSVGKTFGFIECEETKASYGGDVFCLGVQLNGYSVGDTVTFEVGVNEKGKPQAFTIDGAEAPPQAIVPSSPALARGYAGGKACGKGCQALKGWAGGGQQMGGLTPTGETYIGTVKSVTPQFGFIQCPQIQAFYGRDCFINGQLLGSVSVGDTVQFRVGVNDQGQPQALALRPAGPGMAKNGMPGKLGKGVGGAAGCKGTMPPAGGWQVKDSGAGGQGIKRKPEGTGETVIGTVKSSSDKFGFVESEELTSKYGSDCFCLGQKLAGFSVGDAVEVEVGLNEKGQPQALSVTAVSGDAGAEEPAGPPAAKKARSS